MAVAAKSFNWRSETREVYFWIPHCYNRKPESKERKSMRNFFGAFLGKKHFKCTLCDRELFDLGEWNSASNRKAHLKAKQYSILKKTKKRPKQRKERVTNAQQARQSVFSAFAQTTHRINIFRNVACRTLLTERIAIFSQYKTTSANPCKQIPAKCKRWTTLVFNRITGTRTSARQCHSYRFFILMRNGFSMFKKCTPKKLKTRSQLRQHENP